MHNATFFTFPLNNDEKIDDFFFFGIMKNKKWDIMCGLGAFLNVFFFGSMFSLKFVFFEIESNIIGKSTQCKIPLIDVQNYLNAVKIIKFVKDLEEIVLRTWGSFL